MESGVQISPRPLEIFKSHYYIVTSMKIESIYPIDNFVGLLDELSSQIEIYYPPSEIGKRAAIDLVALTYKFVPKLEIRVNDFSFVPNKDVELTIILKEISYSLPKKDGYPHTKITYKKSIGAVSRNYTKWDMNRVDKFISKKLKVSQIASPYSIAFSYNGTMMYASMFFSPKTKVLTQKTKERVFYNKTIAEKENYFIRDTGAFKLISEPLFWDHWGAMYAAAFNVLGDNETIEGLLKRKGVKNDRIKEKLRKQLATSISKVLLTISGVNIEDILEDVNCPKDYRGLVIVRWASGRGYVYKTLGDVLVKNYNEIIDSNPKVLERAGFNQREISMILENFQRNLSHYSINPSKIEKGYLERQLNKKPYNEVEPM